MFDFDFIQHFDELQLDNQLLLLVSMAFSGRDLLAAQHVRRYAFDKFKQLFTTIDVLVTPTTASTAPQYKDDVFPMGETDIMTTTKLIRFDLLQHLHDLSQCHQLHVPGKHHWAACHQRPSRLRLQRAAHRLPGLCHA